MFTYDALVEACLNKKLDPNKKGDNHWAFAKPNHTFKTPFNFKSIDFPKKELDQIKKIGKLIFNLESQKSTRHFYALNKSEDVERMRVDEEFEKFIPILEESMKSWLEQGLKKSKKPDVDLNLGCGVFYKVNPKSIKEMMETNKRLEEFGRQSRRKQARSEESARHFIITC